MSHDNIRIDNQAHPSITWLRCVHQFDSRFSQFDRSQMKLIRQIVVVMIHIFSQDDSYNQDYSLFFIVRGGVQDCRC